MHYCVFGGQYGSEGKGCVSEFLMHQNDRVRWTVIGENAPNSGHTCSAGSVRSIPAASFFADRVILGPDAVIEPELLGEDIRKVQEYRAKHGPPLPGGRLEVHIHPHAAVLQHWHKAQEAECESIKAISSTGSGSGKAREAKYILRQPYAVISREDHLWKPQYWKDLDVRVQELFAWPTLVRQALATACIFECSQGFMLDTNFGLFPHVTSRSTSPRVAIERNGFGAGQWQYCATLRTFPIRTGGPSGPTGGKEVTCADLGVPDEIATVTKRTRRIFEFSIDDFEYMLALVRPDHLFFTHADYLVSQHRKTCRETNVPDAYSDNSCFYSWYIDNAHSYVNQRGPTIGRQATFSRPSDIWFSFNPAQFIYAEV